MNSESPLIKLKTCNACKRQLPHSYFGLRKYSVDGYNPCCKDCRNFRKRRAYRSPNDSLEPILPLADHNRHFLWTLSSKNEYLIGLDLKSLQSATVTFKLERHNQFFLSVKLANGNQYTHMHLGEQSEFIAFAISLLDRLSIRLFHPQDTVALSNWGLLPRSHSETD